MSLVGASSYAADGAAYAFSSPTVLFVRTGLPRLAITLMIRAVAASVLGVDFFGAVLASRFRSADFGPS